MDWVACLVLPEEIEGSSWARIKHKPPFWVVGKLVGKTGREWHMIAVASSVLPTLSILGVPFSLASAHLPGGAVWRPSDDEKKVYGTTVATQRAEDRFVRGAVAGILSGHAPGLARFYRRITQDQSLLVPIEWAILLYAIRVRFAIHFFKTNKTNNS